MYDVGFAESSTIMTILDYLAGSEKSYILHQRSYIRIYAIVRTTIKTI